MPPQAKIQTPPSFRKFELIKCTCSTRFKKGKPLNVGADSEYFLKDSSAIPSPPFPPWDTRNKEERKEEEEEEEAVTNGEVKNGGKKEEEVPPISTPVLFLFAQESWKLRRFLDPTSYSPPPPPINAASGFKYKKIRLLKPFFRRSFTGKRRSPPFPLF